MAATTANQGQFIFTNDESRINFTGNIFTEEFQNFCNELEERFQMIRNDQPARRNTYLTLGGLIKSVLMMLLMLIMLSVVAFSIILGMGIALIINVCKFVYGLIARADKVKVF